MKISSEISVGNNVTVGFDKVKIETTCHGFVSLFIPDRTNQMREIELSRKELREFLARTQPAFVVPERYEADYIPGKPTP